MKAVILAAGLCSRIRSVTNGSPKCLLQFGERTILDFQLESLFGAGVEQVAIVVGHAKEQIVDHVAHAHPEKCDSIAFVANPKFAATNNIYSLWLARHWIGPSDFLCLNADVLYDPGIILPAVATSSDISMIVDEEFRDETMKVIIHDGKVVAMSKSISKSEASGTYIGITKFSRRICRRFFGAMAALIAEGHVKVFFNAAVERLMADGMPVSFTGTAGLPWAEIDDPSDLRFAEANVYPRLASRYRERLAMAASRDSLVLTA